LKIVIGGAIIHQIRQSIGVIGERARTFRDTERRVFKRRERERRRGDNAGRGEKRIGLDASQQMPAAKSCHVERATIKETLKPPGAVTMTKHPEAKERSRGQDPETKINCQAFSE